MFGDMMLHIPIMADIQIPSCYFEKVTKYKDVDFNLPIRKTANSAGYDFEVPVDIVIPPLSDLYDSLIQETGGRGFRPTLTLKETADITKRSKARPTLVPTGVKCYLPEGYYLELSVRSSTPLKHLLILANGVGIIDADYADNPDNEGEIFFQIINLAPFPIRLQKGDLIGQGIIKTYNTTDDDIKQGERIGGFGSTTE